MKKRRYIYALAASLILGSITLTSLSACGESQTQESSKKIIVTGTKNGKVGDQIQLSAQVIGDENAKVTWESLDVAVASVDQNGLVTLNNQGTALIQASYGNIKSSVVNITCYGTSEVVKQLSIVSLPSTLTYKTGATLSFGGLKVMGYDSYDGALDNLSAVDIPNDKLTFSTKEGTKLEKAGKVTITVSYSGYQNTSFTIDVQDVVVVKALKVTSFPLKSKYTLKKGQSVNFDSTGLRVSLFTYKDGVLQGSPKVLENRDIQLSIPSGTELTSEGNYSIEVTHKTEKSYLSDTFSINVFTEDLSIYNLIKTMQDTKNYQVEILNNVGTNNDASGFHYLRTYTEKYYDEIEYQNVINSQTGQIEFSKDEVKNYFGYTGYKDDVTGKKYIIGYKENHLSSIVGTNIVTTTSDNWRDKAASLTTLPSVFSLKNLPVETKNGRFLSTVIEHEPNDVDGSLTIVKYPLIQEFLQFCGWSSNLVTIMSRFEMKIEKEHELSMKAYFGSYGVTEMKVTGLGDCKIQKVESALNKNTIKPNFNVDKGVGEVADKLRSEYAVRYDYNEAGVDLKNPVTYFHKDYYFDSPNNVGFAKINGKIYQFKSVIDPQTKLQKMELTSKTPASSTITDVAKYVETLKSDGAIIYPKDGFKKILGEKKSDGSLTENTLNTFSLYTAFSSASDKCYQSFDDQTKKYYEEYLLGGQAIENGRIWFLTHFATNPDTQKDEIQYVECWDVNLTTGMGSVIPIGGFTKEAATLPWVEEGVKALEASGELK